MPTVAAQRRQRAGNQVGHGFADTRARLDDEVVSLVERIADGLGHLHLLFSRLERRIERSDKAFGRERFGDLFR